MGEQVSSGFNAMLKKVGELATGPVASQLFGQDIWIDAAAVIVNYVFFTGLNRIRLLNNTHDFFSVQMGQEASPSVCLSLNLDTLCTLKKLVG